MIPAPTTERMKVREFVALFGKAQKSGDGWIVQCKAHDDKEPSLKISEGRDGKILTHCHAGCTFDAVLASVGLSPADVAGEGLAPSLRQDNSKPPSEDYDYEDENGQVAFRVTRYYAKSEDGWSKRFVQKRPDGNGGFVNGLSDSVRRVPYNLPAVLAAVTAGEPVYVVEGEKDVHTLRSWGLAATCNAGGAGKWEADFGRFLRGADVVVLPDNDEPGRRHAAAVALSARPFAASVVTLELPGLPEKADVTDWARLGGDAKALAALVHEAREVEADEDIETALVRRPLATLPGISAAAIKYLPDILREVCGFYPAGADRSVALCSALSIVSGMLPNTQVQHFDRHYHLHLMFCLVARSGGGKGILDQISRIGASVDSAVYEDSVRAQEQWEDEKSVMKMNSRGPGAKMSTPKPIRVRYFLPANASKTYLLNAVKASAEVCGGSACIVETEIDTLVGANQQEWGDFSDLIRKAFHHETYRMGRMGAGEADMLVIEDPSLALAVSGTWGQFVRLFGAEGLDNGLFNRFFYFASTAARSYRSSRPTQQSIDRERWMHTAASELGELFDVLHSRRTPLTIGMKDEGWDELDSVFQPEYDAAAVSPIAERLLPFVQRVNVMAVRLVGIITVLRCWDQRAPLDTIPHVTANAFDVRLALNIARIWYAHGYALLTHLNSDMPPMSPLMSLSDGCRDFFKSLPAGSFKRSGANEAGARVGAAERTVKKYLSDLQEAGLLDRDGHTYTKIEVPEGLYDFDPEEALQS